MAVVFVVYLLRMMKPATRPLVGCCAKVVAVLVALVVEVNLSWLEVDYDVVVAVVVDGGSGCVALEGFGCRLQRLLLLPLQPRPPNLERQNGDAGSSDWLPLRPPIDAVG